MLTLHHLEYSRSQRVLWLLEELGVPFELVRYQRGANFRAPASLSEVHPLGKSPVIVDGGLTLAESATILRYLNDRHGQGRFTPEAGTDAYYIHDEWLDYVESSAVMPVMIALLGKMTGESSGALQDFCRPEIAKALGHIADGLGDKTFLMGDDLMLADIQISYFLGMAVMAGLLDGYPTLRAYYDRLCALPGFVRAIEKGGPMILPGL
jgi:glutathione S-transferase